MLSAEQSFVVPIDHAEGAAIAAGCGRNFAVRVLLIAAAVLLIAAVPAAAIDLLAGKTAVFKDHPAGAGKDEATVKFVADPAIVGPLPDPTTSASTIEIRTDTRVAGSLVLAPGRWKAVKKGFVYKDPEGAAGGVKKVVLRTAKPGGMLLIQLAGAAYGANPVSAPLSFVEVSLTVGGTQYCGRFASPPSRLEVRGTRVRFDGPSTACAAIQPPTATATATPTPTSTPTGTPTPTPCAPGYELQGGVCVDINECAACPGSACPCGRFGGCTNTPGSFTCTYSPPFVTAVIPFDNPIDGTGATVILRGVRMGLNDADLVSVYFNALECEHPDLIDDSQETVITCTLAVGTVDDVSDDVDVVVTTRSGGAGTCQKSPPLGCARLIECLPDDRDCMGVCHGGAVC